jgi:hypothetical protein
MKSKYHGAVTVICKDAIGFARLTERLEVLENIAATELSPEFLRVTLFAVDQSESMLLAVARVLEELDVLADIVSEKGRLDDVFRSITEAEGVR